MIMNESKLSLTTKVARVAMVLVALVAALAALQALSAQPTQASSFSKIAFESFRDNNWDIYTMNSDGTGLRRITFSSASDTQPSLSPDGNKIVYISDMDNSRGDIYSIEPLVGFPNITTRLTFGDALERAPSVSTSGKIAFSRPTQLGRIGAQNWDILTMNSDGTGQTRLTFNSVIDGNAG